jgi:hypothetical protein
MRTPLRNCPPQGGRTPARRSLPLRAAARCACVALRPSGRNPCSPRGADARNLRRARAERCWGARDSQTERTTRSDSSRVTGRRRYARHTSAQLLARAARERAWQAANRLNVVHRT